MGRPDRGLWAQAGRVRLGWALALASAIALLLIAATTASLPRDLSTLVIVAGPGMAWVPLLTLDDRAFEVMATILVSVTVVIIVAQIDTYAAGFSWRPCEFALLAVTLIGLILRAALLRRQIAHEPEGEH